MTVGYDLVNVTKREMVSFVHIPARSWGELCGNSVAAAITSCYLLESSGDRVAFVPDDGSYWPFEDVSPRDICNFREVTDEVVDKLIMAGVLSDRGREVFDSREPDAYVRLLENVWNQM